LVVSADERFVYSAGAAEGGVKQWSVETGKLLVAIKHGAGAGAGSGGGGGGSGGGGGGGGSVTALALLPEGAGAAGQMGAGAAAALAAAAAGGRRLLSAGADGCVNIWATDATDAVAGASLSARTRQREAALAASEHQNKQLRDAAKVGQCRLTISNPH